MKAIRYSLLASVIVLAVASTATVTATKSPPILGGNWWWKIPGYEVHLNHVAVWWYSHTDDDGVWDTTLFFWPPRIQRSFMSKELRANNMRKDWDTPEAKAEWCALHNRDDQQFWTWPDWHGLNGFRHCGSLS
jgi:hypothetical protein